MPIPKKPATLKLISGTARPDRPSSSADMSPLTEVPPAPDWLTNAHAVREWDRLARVLLANSILTEGGLGPLAWLCALHGKMVQRMLSGKMPTGDMIGRYRSLTNDFGLPPMAQGKVKVGKESKANPFQRNGKPKPVA